MLALLYHITALPVCRETKSVFAKKLDADPDEHLPLLQHQVTQKAVKDLLRHGVREREVFKRRFEHCTR